MIESDFIDQGEPFHLRIYRKQELAMMYFPDVSKESATRNLRRWVARCTELSKELEKSGFDKNRKFYLRHEVELIIKFLGLP